jgi:predicted Zn-dependent peptidase
VILEEIKMYEDLPQEHVHSLFEECVWPEHSLGRDIAGSRETVSALSRTQLADHFAREYRAERILIVAAGALAAESVRETVESIFAAACAGTSPAPAPAPTPFTEPRLVLRTRRTEQAHICVGGLSSSYQSPLRYAEEILNTVLGEGMSSRLFLEVREKRGLAYDVHSFMTKYSDTGLHGVYAGVETRRAREAVSAILHEARRLAEELVPPAELEKAREFYKGRLLLSLESTNGLAAWLGGQELLLGRVEQPAEVLARLDADTAEEIRAAARRLYVDQPLRLAVIGPFRSEAPFLKLIAG